MKKLVLMMMALAMVTLPGAALATNGMNMISYGGQEAGMAGASLAVSDNAMAMNNNPAGLAQVKGKELIVGLSLLMPKLSHSDSMNGKVDGETAYFPLPTLAYAQRLGGSGFVLGLGVFAQGGMGADFKNLRTAFGTVDETYTNVRYVKLAPTLAYQVNDQFSLGLALNLGYADMEMRFFPNTMVAGVFAGMQLGRVYSFGYGAKLGAMYKPNDMISLGITYTTKTAMTFEHGNIEFAGMGSFEAKVEGFNWPSSIGFGVALRPTSRLLIAFDVTYMQWSKAVDQVVIVTNAPAPMNRVVFDMGWEDQWVFAIGAAYQVTDKLTLRAGYNYGKNPVPAENLSPLFPAIVEHHITLGLGYQFSPTVKLDVAFEHAFDNSVTYDNPNAPFGPGAQESHSQNTIHMFLTFSF